MVTWYFSGRCTTVKPVTIGTLEKHNARSRYTIKHTNNLIKGFERPT